MAATRVVNIRTDAFDVYVGRAGHGQSGLFGNPFRVVSTRRSALEMFRSYFAQRVETDPEFRRRVLELRGKTLGCFCARKGGVTSADRPYVCHGQVIAEWLDGLSKGGA